MGRSNYNRNSNHPKRVKIRGAIRQAEKCVVILPFRTLVDLSISIISRHIGLDARKRGKFQLLGVYPLDDKGWLVKIESRAVSVRFPV